VQSANKNTTVSGSPLALSLVFMILPSLECKRNPLDNPMCEYCIARGLERVIRHFFVCFFSKSTNLEFRCRPYSRPSSSHGTSPSNGSYKPEEETSRPGTSYSGEQKPVIGFGNTMGGLRNLETNLGVCRSLVECRLSKVERRISTSNTHLENLFDSILGLTSLGIFLVVK
jgi:hypothetical protein